MASKFVDLREKLEMRPVETISRFDQVRTMPDQPDGSLITNGLLIDAVRNYGVEITEIKTSRLSDNEVKGVPFPALTITTKVEGNARAIFKLIIELNTYFNSSTIQSIEINNSEDASIEKSNATIGMIVYMN